MDFSEAGFLTWRKLLTLVLAIAFAGYCCATQADNLSCCDFESYVNLGRGFAEHRQIVDFSGTRVYGYPLLVSLPAWLGARTGIDMLALLYVGQVLGYLGAVLLLSRTLAAQVSLRTGELCFYALVLNAWVYPYLTVPLADGAAVVLLVLAACVLCHLHDPERLAPMRAVPAWFALGFLLGFAVMVRPANLGWIVIALPALALAWRTRDPSAALAGAAALATGYLVAVAPQLQINWRYFETLSFLPTRDIGAEQLQWGLAWLKYGTAMAPDLQQMIYRNPWAPAGPQGMTWYLLEPDGWRTLALRIFAALDTDYLFPYVRRFDSPWRPLLFAATHGLLFWGVLGLARQWLRLRRGGGWLSPLGHYVQALTLLLAAWLAIHFSTAVENRFALPVFAALLPLAAGTALEAWRDRRWRLAAAWLAYLAMAWPLSAWVSSLRG